MEKVLLEAKKRTVINKASRSALRKEGNVPAIFYSKNHEPLAIEVSERAVHPLVFTSKAHLVSLKLEGQEELECIVKDVQFDPVTDRIVHMDFLGLKKGEKIQLEVPVQFIGSAIGIKEGGVLQQVLHKLEIECLPADIPDHLEINITDLKLGKAVHISDLKYDNIVFLNSPESIIVTVAHPKVEKVSAATEGTEVAEPEVIGKGKQDKEEE